MWIYTAIMRPRLTYAALVWWRRVELSNVKSRLERIRGLILRGVTGASKSTPMAALGALTGLEPLHLTIKAVAAKAAWRISMGASGRILAKFRIPTDICSKQADLDLDLDLELGTSSKRSTELVYPRDRNGLMASDTCLTMETRGSQMAPRTKREQEPVSTAGGLEWVSQSRCEPTPQSNKLRSWLYSNIPTRHRSTVIEGTSEFSQIAGLL